MSCCAGESVDPDDGTGLGATRLRLRRPKVACSFSKKASQIGQKQKVTRENLCGKGEVAHKSRMVMNRGEGATKVKDVGSTGGGDGRG